ncbi:MAG: hypothetical protein M0P69_03710 [Bacteroidales bacterium]|nr:hypothetical protein [Bacteroidales bacterium]
MDWILQNWTLIVLGLLIIDKIVTVTPCKWDDLIFTSIKQALLSVTGKKLPVVFLAFGVAAQMLICFPGCAVKTIADLSPRDQAIATVDLLIDEYVDLHEAYVVVLPSLTDSQQSWCKATLAPVMNIAKRSIKLASDAAIIWKISDATNATTQSEAYSAALAEARSALDDAISLYTVISGGK